jgi:hypothetical protein
MAYPASASFKHQERSSRLWALLTLFSIKGIALIPHLIVLYVLQLVSSLLMLIGYIATLINGRYPQGIENFVVGVARWGFRMMAYYTCMTDKYPPFSMKSSSDYPADLNFQHQEKSSRLWVLLTIIPVKHIMLIPHIVVLFVMAMIAAVCMFLGIFATLFTGKYPLAFEKVLVTFFQYSFRIGTYAMCLTDKYPPLGWKE